MVGIMLVDPDDQSNGNSKSNYWCPGLKNLSSGFIDSYVLIQINKKKSI